MKKGICETCGKQNPLTKGNAGLPRKFCSNKCRLQTNRLSFEKINRYNNIKKSIIRNAADQYYENKAHEET